MSSISMEDPQKPFSIILKGRKVPVDIFILWRPLEEALPALLKRQASKERDFAIAAVLPSQKLDCALLDLIEEHGLLLIEFPEFYRNMDAQSVTMAIAVSTSMDMELAETAGITEVVKQAEILLKKMDDTPRKMTKEEEERLLANLNNPNAVDSFW